MNLTLTRNRFKYQGIFGDLKSDDGKLSLFTLEHAYAVPSGTDWVPKLPEGLYTCRRGQHNLKGRVERGLPPFDTFEITGVPGHTDILFHVGNFNGDSEGCVLVGMQAGEGEVTGSREAFQKFMDAQIGVDSFQLTVKNASL